MDLEPWFSKLWHGIQSSWQNNGIYTPFVVEYGAILFLYFWLVNIKSVIYGEQYPLLNIAIVMEIIDKVVIYYLFNNMSGFLYVFTSDFLITMSYKEMVRSIRKKKELDKPCTSKKLEIERIVNGMWYVWKKEIWFFGLYLFLQFYLCFVRLF